MVRPHLSDLGLDSGDIVLFDRSCLSMMHPLSTTICGFAKLTSRFDHVGIIARIEDSLFDSNSILREAVKERSPLGLYVFEANLNGVTLRPLERRVERSSSNSIVVRRICNVIRDDKFYSQFNSHVETLLRCSYRDNISDLIALAVDTPDSAHRREVARQLLSIRAQMEGIHVLADSGLLADAAVSALDGNYKSQYELLASNIDQPNMSDTKIVCSELVASTLQACGVLAEYPSFSSYLPRDFDALRSSHRLIFRNPAVQLSDYIFLSGDEKPADCLPSATQSRVEFEDTPSPVRALPSRCDLKVPILKISQAYLLSTGLTCVLLSRQTSQQLRWCAFARGSVLTFTAGVCFRIATAASLHAQLAFLFDGDVRDYFTTSKVDLGHPFYDVLIRGGSLGFLACLATLPIEMLNLRYHFYGYKKWYVLPFRSIALSSFLTLLTANSYCGAFCWPMYYEAISPFFLPLAPSYFRGFSHISVPRQEELHQHSLGLKMALTLCCVHQLVVYPLETIRLRYMIDKRPSFRNPFLGFRYFLARGLCVSGLSYFLL